MGSEKLIVFDPFRLDLANECLRKGPETIKLRPKAFAVLDYLVERPGQLVTKEELLSAVWPETFVGEAVLKVAIRQIREALDDDSTAPRFIETAHRRGYRFIGRVKDEQKGIRVPEGPGDRAVSAPPVRAGDALQRVVGREGVVTRMRWWLEKSLSGERQIVFVTGEAGIGKTSVVDMFARSLASERSIRIGRGQCLEQYGTGEAYLPVLEAIGRLCREQEKVVDLLRAHAPMWLLQLPSLVSAADRELLSREVSGATRERMLREMGEALEALTAEQPLVLILEDLHWSDYSTLDLISYLARQRQAAKLMVIGTYRTVELIISGHPLKAVKQELLAKRQCVEVPLEYLSEEAVSRYLSVRFPRNRFPGELAALIHDRTEGSPLFMVNAVDYLVAEGSIVEQEGNWDLVAGIETVDVGVPDSIKQMIEKQIDHLDGEQQRTLQAASVAGAEFSAVAVAAGLGEDVASVEARCDELARQRQFIQDRGVQELGNGEALSRYGFIHALYQNVLYDRVPASRRVQLHRRIGEHEEALYGERATEMAAELAMHFERGASYGRAVNYLQQAAETAVRRFAYREAVGLSRHGLELLGRLPETAERTRQELQLHITLGVPLIATEGYAAPNVGHTYTRARELCGILGQPPEIAQVLWGLWTFHLLKGELATARGIAEEFLRLATYLTYPGLALRGHWAMEITFMHMGEFELAMEHFERAIALYDPERHRDDAFRFAQNPGVAMRCFAAISLWFLGQPDRALNVIQQAVTFARELSEPHGLAHALFFAALLHQLRREEKMALDYAEATIAVSEEHEMVLYHAMARVARGWALNQQGWVDDALEEMREGLAAHHATGTELLGPHFLALLAEALGKAGRAEEGILLLDRALTVAARTGEQYYQAEVHRLRGELLLKQKIRDEHAAAECFHRSIEAARRQQAKSLELRAARCLARLYSDHSVKEESQGVLAQIYDGFTEGFDTADLREAKALLAGYEP